jgi:hypothetical protein
MLVQRKREERRARESKFEKTEVFLSKLRQDAARAQQATDVMSHVGEREFTARLVNKIRANAFLGDDFDYDDDEEEDSGGGGGRRGRHGGFRKAWSRSGWNDERRDEGWWRCGCWSFLDRTRRRYEIDSYII